MDDVKTKIIDYRSISLRWLINFRNGLLNRSIGANIELVVAKKKIKIINGARVRVGDTLRLEYNREAKDCFSYVVSRPYGKDSFTAEVLPNCIDRKERRDWSTEDVCEYIVKERCMEERCTYLETLPRETVSNREYVGAFVSQARKCKFDDLVNALTYFYTLKPGVDLDKQFVWLDLFCANQPELTASDVTPAIRRLNEESLTDGLHSAIANFEERVLFLDRWDNPVCLRRAWCVWELYGVAKAQKEIEIALPAKAYDRFIVTLKNDYESIITTISKVDTKAAKCITEADLNMIHREIKANGSFEVIDDIVKNQLRLWVGSTGQLQIEKEERKGFEADVNEIRVLATLSGMIYLEIGKLSIAEELFNKALRIAEEGSVSREDDTSVALQLNKLGRLYEEQVRDSRFLFCI